MSNILQTLLDTYQTNPAAALAQIPELGQAVEDGKIIELPCKVGDMVYEIVHRTKNSISETVVSSDKVSWIQVAGYKKIYYYSVGKMFPFSNEDINQTVFLTREAAAQALKERAKNG